MDIKSSEGYYVLDRMCYPETNRIEIVKVPVIAWRVSPDKTLHGLHLIPMCAEPISDLWCGEILHPDGTVTPTDMWKSYSEFVESVTLQTIECNRIATTVSNRNSELEPCGLETTPKARCIVRRADTIPLVNLARNKGDAN